MNLGFEIASRDLLSMSATTCDYQKIWKVTGTKCGKHGKTAREVTSQGVCNGAGNSCNGFFVLNPRTTPSHRCHLSEKPTGDSGHKVAISAVFSGFHGLGPLLVLPICPEFRSSQAESGCHVRHRPHAPAPNTWCTIQIMGSRCLGRNI